MSRITRTVRGRPPSSMESSRGSSIIHSNGDDDGDGDDVGDDDGDDVECQECYDYSEDGFEDYESEEEETRYNYAEDSFDEYESEKKEKKRKKKKNEELEEGEMRALMTLHIGNGIQVTGPEECLKHRYETAALPAPERSTLLSKSNHYQDEVMVTDMYQLEPGLKNCKYTHVRIPVVLPTTRLNISDLFNFHAMVLTSNRWHEVAADYNDNYVTFPVHNLDCFVIYARPIPVIKNVTPRGFTFVFDEDADMTVEIPEDAVDATITIKMKRHLVDLGRIEWYRSYDPTAFQGIYALSDILTVTRKMDQAFKKDPLVELKTNRVTESNYQVKSVQSHNRDKFSVTSTQSVSDRKNRLKVSHQINNYNSVQALFVAPEIPDSMILQAAQYGAGILHMCSVLFFISKNPKGKWLTVELVESPDANTLVSSRKRQNYFEIQNSRVCGVYVRTNDRLRVTLGGNLVHVDKYQKLRYSTNKNSQYCFQFSPQSCNNNIHLRIEKGVYGTPYSVVEVKISKATSMETHFPFPEAGMNLSNIKATLHGDYLNPNLHVPANRRDSTVRSKNGQRQVTSSSTWSSSTANLSVLTNAGVEADVKGAGRRKPQAAHGDALDGSAVDHVGHQVIQVYTRRCSNTRNYASQASSSSSSTGFSSSTDSGAVAGAYPSVSEFNRGHARRDLKVTMPTSRAEAGSGNEDNKRRAKPDPTAPKFPKGQVSNPARAFGEQNRPNTSSTASASDQNHPLLSDASLQVLGSCVNMEDLQRVIVQLGMTYDQIRQSKTQADHERLDHGYVLLRHWFNRNKGKVSDRELIDKLRNAFMDGDRCDIAEKLTRVQGRNRPLRPKDFK